MVDTSGIKSKAGKYARQASSHANTAKNKIYQKGKDKADHFIDSGKAITDSSISTRDRVGIGLFAFGEILGETLGAGIGAIEGGKDKAQEYSSYGVAAGALAASIGVIQAPTLRAKYGFTGVASAVSGAMAGAAVSLYNKNNNDMGFIEGAGYSIAGTTVGAAIGAFAASKLKTSKFTKSFFNKS